MVVPKSFHNRWTAVFLIFVAEVSSSEKEEDVFMGMVCPSGTNPDDSPLYVLCCNDTCSFTWTGAEHINQVSDSTCPWFYAAFRFAFCFWSSLELKFSALVLQFWYSFYAEWLHSLLIVCLGLMSKLISKLNVRAVKRY